MWKSVKENNLYYVQNEINKYLLFTCHHDAYKSLCERYTKAMVNALNSEEAAYVMRNSEPHIGHYADEEY